MPYLKRQKTPEKALASLMRLASKAEKSSGDARRLMRLWGLEKEEADKVLAQLIELKFIDDERFASAYVREKLRFNGWGEHRIRAGLFMKGVARDIANAAIAEHVEHEENDERLVTKLARKLKFVKGASQWEKRSKLTRYGLSLGHDYDTVKEAVDKVFKAADDD
jgi:regulatory protein